MTECNILTNQTEITTQVRSGIHKFVLYEDTISVRKIYLLKEYYMLNIGWLIHAHYCYFLRL